MLAIKRFAPYFFLILRKGSGAFSIKLPITKNNLMYRVEQYTTDYFNEWNDFVAGSKNGTFLFNRNFMEYHSDRFADFSLMVYDGENVVALLPAHVVDGILYSHQGLTYGGLVINHKIKLQGVIAVVRAVLYYLHTKGITTLVVKTIPFIYHAHPAQEFDYVLFLCNAVLKRRDSLFVIENSTALPITKTRREAIRRGQKNGLTIVEEENFDLFWNEILLPNMAERHGVQPVHSAAEIRILQQNFPENIRHFNVYNGKDIVAGTTIFVTDTVAHAQHISGNAERNQLGSLDYLYAHLITNVFADKKYFDFGISNEAHGRKLNTNLAFWKESFGARTVVHDFYEVETANYILLEDVFI